MTVAVATFLIVLAIIASERMHRTNLALLGAAIVMARNRGIDIMASGLGPVLIINLVITFFPGFNISVGGHLGGLIGGFAAAFAIEALASRLCRAVAVR